MLFDLQIKFYDKTIVYGMNDPPHATGDNLDFIELECKGKNGGGKKLKKSIRAKMNFKKEPNKNKL